MSLYPPLGPTVVEYDPVARASLGAVADATPAHRPHAPTVPTEGAALRVGSCDLYFELAKGGMAIVYLGVHRGALGFQKLVAVKRLLPRFQDDPRYVAMLVDEASVSSYPSHSSLRDVFDIGTADDGTPYLVMEFLVGEPLSRICAAIRGETELLQSERHHRVAASILASCCRGIHAAHELSDRRAPLEVVHRDLAPDNLFALHDGGVRVTDFGIMRARVRRQPPSGETTLKGKAGYMSPEYLQRRPYDRRTDVWTLGVVLWELLTGVRLFRRARDVDTLAAVLEQPIPPPSMLCRGVDPRLDEIVGRAASRDLAARYATAEEMAVDLDSYVASGGNVGSSDVGAWLRQILPESLPTLTGLVDATRRRAARGADDADSSGVTAVQTG